ncbi:hypothetical protein [Ramlibacter pallidus]|uniref:Fatty acid desaturase n=1 Tax=Ramlibacter pallidus TaxID=2780087 RepID=A0ABR9S823_9BURK|nr:hypothetical protein [Ramlibacter pallidus]MBE7369700.1 hypothetical protein [Ramlibacter pallidus]
MTLAELQRIKQWHARHHHDHPVEYHLWDAMLTLWLMGWVGWLPAFAFDALWTAPLLLLGMSAPTLYAGWRGRAHRANSLRCDWLR